MDRSDVILVAGEALIDLLITPAGYVSAALGGAPFNTARACSRLGAEVAFVGAISNDRFGQMLAAQLAADGVGLGFAQRVDLPTTLAAAELDEDGAATYRFYIERTSAPELGQLPKELLDSRPEAFFTGGLGLVLEPMASVIEQMIADLVAGHPPIVMMIDLNCRPLLIEDRDAYVRRVRPMLAAASVVKVSSDDLAYLDPGVDPGIAACALVADGATAVLLTDGAAEIRLFTASAQSIVSVPPVDVVDTIGAGDTFSGAFLASWIAAGRGRHELASIDALVPAGEIAIRAAGLACQRAGADPPRMHDLRLKF